MNAVRTRAAPRKRNSAPFDFLDVTSKQNRTHHLKVLCEAGLIQSRYEGRKKFVSLRRDLIDDMFPGMLDGLLSAVAASEKNS
jgi:DNA-binding transcriptional ArsR family regulator